MAERIAALVVGTVLAVLAVAVTAIWHDSGLAVVFAVAGVALIVFGVVADRLKSIGPGGVEFYEIREYSARLVGLIAAGSPSFAGGSTPDQAAARIRAAKTPEELLNELASIAPLERDRG